MTLHNAKGLEYPIVFMIGCEEGVFPHSRALDEGGLEEERRLCYVGITRAERDLYITYARTRTVFGARSYGAPSSFVSEIPAELTDREAQAPRGFGVDPRARRPPGAGRRTSSASREREPRPAPVAYRLGEDVVHAAFGEGVVTGRRARRDRRDPVQQGPLRAQARRRSGADLEALGPGDPVAASATIIDGKAVAAQVRARGGARGRGVDRASGRRPGLATILVGDDPASAIYVANKRKACAEVGIVDLHRHLPADATQEQVAALIEECNADPQVNGILLQLPVPAGLDGKALTGLIAPDKDVDGLTPISAGRLWQGVPGLRPCTPLGVIELLDSYGVALEGAEAVVVGRSDLVGKPVAALLLQRNATVTMCHSRTRDLPGVCSRADVLIAAVGVPEMIGAEYVKQGAAVIDVGMNRTDDGLRGDVSSTGRRARGR